MSDSEGDNSDTSVRVESPVIRKKIRDTRDASDYESHSDKVQAYEISDTWIGSDKIKKFQTYILPLLKGETEISKEKRKFIEKEINVPEGVVRIFLEIVSNAVDNVIASLQAGVDPGKIEITMNEKTISVKNYGLHIPIKKMGMKGSKNKTKMVPYEKGMKKAIYPPEFIFGRFRTSSNYDKSVVRYGCGRNGVGAKVTNLYSHRFKVTVEDPDTQLKFVGIWKDNFFKDLPPKSPEAQPDVKVTDRDGKIKKGFVHVEWDLDFERFKMKKYTKNIIDYFARIAADFSFACKTHFVFNKIVLDYRDIHDYATLYFKESEIKNSIVQYTWGFEKPPRKGSKKKVIRINESSNKKMDKSISCPKKPKDIPDLEIMILDTPDKSRVFSYVNGLVTKNGGNHVDAVLKPIIEHLRKVVNGDKKGALTVAPKDIKPHLSLIVNARIPDPGYDSQSKTKLESPDVYVELEEILLKKTNSWDVVNRLFAELEAKGFRNSKSTDGKKQPNVKMKGEDANFAGDSESLRCVLNLTEGESAAGYPQWRASMLEGGLDYNGYMPLRGKILNVTKAKMIKYIENKVIGAIKTAMGFQEGVDYSLEKNLKGLRYGFLVIVADADVDGMHIAALILNVLREKFPGFLKSNRVSYLRTPIIKAYQGKKIVKRFFVDRDFKQWKEENPGEAKKLRIRYLKGLGTSSRKDVEDDIDHAPTMICFYDKKARENFDVAFAKHYEDDRKEWIDQWRDVTQIKDILSVDLDDICDREGLFDGQNISQFINRELVGYSVSTLYRAIPSEYDFLKESQRKSLYGMLTRFDYKRTVKDKPIKIDSIANAAAADLHYHHGPKNLSDTIIRMTQDFTGTNNMGYFTQDGMFGTRADGGRQAAAARYSEVRLNWWVPLVFYKESVELVKKREIDGETGEPKWIPSVIPVGIINGFNGIATGYSTYMPCHNPLLITLWCIAMCLGEEPDEILPWFNGFQGDIIYESGKANVKKIEEEVLPGDLNAEDNFDASAGDKDTMDVENITAAKHASKSKNRIRTVGKFCRVGYNKKNEQILKITELPVRTWTVPYKNWLKSLILEKPKDRVVTYIRDKSKPNTVNIEIHWKSTTIEPDIHNLKLQRSYGLSNITLIDHQGFPKKYKNVKKVLNNYYTHMIEHYTDLRDHRIKIEEDKIQRASYKARYIQARLEGTIKVVKEDEDKIRSELKKIDVPFKIYEEAKERDLSKQSLERWKKQRKEAEARLKTAKNDTPENIWLEKLRKIEKELRKRWKEKKNMFDMEE
jgi:DNA topoisomerase II